MSKHRWILAIPLVLVACQKSPDAYQPAPSDRYPTEERSDPEGFAERGLPTPDIAGRRTGLPPAIQNLQQHVSQLRGATDMQYTDVALALRTLSAAFRALPNGSPAITDEVTKIESYADRIEAAGATSNMQARWARRALTESVDALELYEREQGLTGMADRFDLLQAQIGRIDEDQPLTAQKNTFVGALDQIADVLVEFSAPRQQPGTQ